MLSISITLPVASYATNKLFKSDSQRVAFSLCVDFGVEVPYGDLVIACFTP
ncbi:DUF3265 domain-containing protein [Vibrio diabolicus]|uniref:DUF3265 domain-containing protein n=1 Tax=Vibrio diabolicus TaxID=50719 RepID=A0AAX1XG89_9VIBR|nr:DUF3265 domain-containing protein [Vibrio diabolicus]